MYARQKISTAEKFHALVSLGDSCKCVTKNDQMMIMPVIDRRKTRYAFVLQSSAQSQPQKHGKTMRNEAI